MEQIIDSWPKAHTDFLTQYIDYRVPPEQAHLVAMFDGSILVDRTRGEVAARCDSEAATPGAGRKPPTVALPADPLGDACQRHGPGQAWSAMPGPMSLRHRQAGMAASRNSCARSAGLAQQSVLPYRPEWADYESDVGRRSGRRQMDRACSHRRARRSRRLQTIQKDRLDDQVEDQGASDKESDASRQTG